MFLFDIIIYVRSGELFCDECILSEKFMLAELPDYFIGEEGDLKHYKELIRAMPQTDHPLAFGQHSNSDMAASIDGMMDSITSEGLYI